MNPYLGVLSASLATFAATNIDDAFLLTFFFARRIPTRRIVAGQYAGFAAIVGLSLIGVWGALAISHQWVRFLGLAPLVIGIKHLLHTRRKPAELASANKLSVPAIALMTLSNGADNIGVYMPFFIISRAKLWVILITYAVLVAVWCWVGQWLGGRPLILRLVGRWGHWAVPVVFIGMGIYILKS